MKNSQKGSVTLWTIIILIVIVGVGAYLYKNTISPSASSGTQSSELKTYTNTNFGYEIKYPTDYTLNEVNNPNIESSTRDIAEITSSQVRVGIIASKDRNSINDECRDVSKYAPSKKIGDNTFNVIVSETATTDMGNPDNVHRDYYLKTQSSCYLITTTYPPSLQQTTKDTYNSQIETIVSTFKVK